ncbi:MAG: DoxX family membrane protein, partial [Planctomycetes bacterium]|nr:DoxX family membrane protein [Planctomycetota bacterium]
MHSTNDIRPPKPHFNSMSRVMLTLVRIAIGWHFLYEGLTKVFADKWTSAGFLQQSDWLLADTFHWIASNPTALGVVDFLNAWGLIAIGLGLFVGLFTRIASSAGALLLALYYIASPPLIGSAAEA